jgi:DNA-binding transcriptional MerR regulator
MIKVLGTELVDRTPQHTITIGQLAAYAGVTIKAVRHYHHRGLLEEPQRDSSGYRRYTAQHAIDLIKIKTLAEAGVPLARIKELLAADADRFAAAITEIDRNLQERAMELRRTRERLARLRSGDRLFVSAEVADFLDRLRELGVSERTVQMERDGWILMQSASPKQAAIWIADKRDAIGDPEFRSIYLKCDAAFDWSPDDPRLYALADRTERWMAKRHRRRTGEERPVQDPIIARLATASVSVSSPAWDRLSEIAKERKAGGDGMAPRGAVAPTAGSPACSQVSDRQKGILLNRTPVPFDCGQLK